jgi:hypothetical protein
MTGNSYTVVSPVLYPLKTMITGSDNNQIYSLEEISAENPTA